MSITKDELNAFKRALDESARPLFFFDDDCDGTTSFLQLYRYKKDGKGIAVKASPILKAQYVRKVEEYEPDLIIILDKPMVDEEFFDKVHTPIIWLDHHKPQDVSRWNNVTYYNPRIHDDENNLPTTYWVYQITDGPIWLATVGVIADWHIPDFLPKFEKIYPDLLPPVCERVEDLLFHPKSKVGRLAQIISFNLKGTVHDTMKSVLVLTRIESPYEILNQTTPKGRYLYKKYLRLADNYRALLERIKGSFKKEDPLLVFTYSDETTSLTSDLSNELLYLYPEKLIMIARRHGGEYKYSIRSAGKQDVPSMLNKALKGINGYGGGHKFACGACIKERDNEHFIDSFREQIAKK